MLSTVWVVRDELVGQSLSVSLGRGDCELYVITSLKGCSELRGEGNECRSHVLRYSHVYPDHIDVA